jgi:spore coat polysaccharide biosynthesis protein SpsF (cytidylyltransferase family)
VIGNKQELVEALVQAGCNVHQKSRDNVTARHMAVQMRRTNLIPLIPVE